MQNLDNQEDIKKLDPSGVLKSICLFSDQCFQAWSESSQIKFPLAYEQVQNIVVCGMGGSRFTPRTIKELFSDRIRVPYEIIDDYTVPAYVDQHSLVIVSSYSGSTEEPISAGKAALKRGAKLTAVTSGAQVAKMMRELQLPAYIFNDIKYNPCRQPRIGSGYMLLGHLGILKSLKFIKIETKEIFEAIKFAELVGKQYYPQVRIANNLAKQLAKILYNKHAFIVSAEFLKGFANGFANQINENAKMISDYRFIPELNHHLMEGLQRPASLHDNGLFLFILSNLYSPEIQKRFAITQEVVTKQKLATHRVILAGKTKLAQALEAFTLSGFSSFYLAMLYGTDPIKIPWVDYFKEQLAKV